MIQPMQTQPYSVPVYFVSLGCPKNLVDSQVMLGLLQKDKYRVSNDADQAEVIIINTCSFIEASKEESIETILELAQKKESGKCKVLVVSGCLPQRYSKQLEREMPEVDLFIGTGQYHRITELLKLHENREADGRAKKGENEHLPRRSYIDEQPAFIHTEKDPRLYTGPVYTGYLKLSEGCNRRCSFCIIPKLRGNVRSRTIASLVEEAKLMASRKVRELNLVAQDLTEFGMEGKYRERLEGLLPELCRVTGIEWIRLHYVYPDEFSDELIAIIRDQPKIVKYLDLPIQHTSDKILSSMNRKLTKAKLFKLINKLRAEIPGIVFRTSIIVGFPGETEEDFKELCDDLVELNLDHVGVFRYSREAGTAAAKMKNHIHPTTRRRREKELTKLLHKRSVDRLEKYVGKSFPVLIEGPSPETDLLIQGRLPSQAQEIDGHVMINELAGELSCDSEEDGVAGEATGLRSSLEPGDLVEVEISEILSPDLVGKAIRMIKKS